MVTSSGGAVGLTLDAVDDAGAALAELTADTVADMEDFVPEDVDVHNPMDAGSGLAGNVEDFCKLGRMFAADDNVDILALQGRVPLADDPLQTPEPYIELKALTDKPVLAFTRMVQNCDASYRNFQAAADMPFLQGIPTMVCAVQALVRYGERRRGGIVEISPPGGDADNLAGDALAGTLDKLGLTQPRQSFAATPDEAAVKASEIGFPVALKIVSSDVSHKTEIGGVRLDLATSDSVFREAEDLQCVMEGQKLEGFLVQVMVQGVEMIVGVRDDPQFGPLVLVGLGGVLVEVLRDVSLRLAPVDVEEARTMLGELRGAKMLDAFRGQSSRDVDALAGAVAGLSRFYLDHRPWLEEIEVNPLIVLEQDRGVRAVDIRPVLREG